MHERYKDSVGLLVRDMGLLALAIALIGIPIGLLGFQLVQAYFTVTSLAISFAGGSIIAFHYYMDWMKSNANDDND